MNSYRKTWLVSSKIKCILYVLLLLVTLDLYNPIIPTHIFPTTQELNCLVRNVYYEARGESREGQMAVTWVTLNRLKTHAPTICQVVYAPNQFSWTKNLNKLPRIDKKIWEEVKGNVLLAYNTRGFDATYFHNNKVNPKWRLKYMTQIGNHHFYKTREI